MNSKKKKIYSSIERYNFYGFNRRYSKNELETQALLRDLYGEQKGKKFIEDQQKKPELLGDILKEIKNTNAPIDKSFEKIKSQWSKIIPSVFAKLIHPLKRKNKSLIIQCKDSYVKDILEERYYTFILRKVQKINTSLSSLKFQINDYEE